MASATTTAQPGAGLECAGAEPTPAAEYGHFMLWAGASLALAGESAAARSLMRQAIAKGADRRVAARLLLAVAYLYVGRAALLADQPAQAIRQLRTALDDGVPGGAALFKDLLAAEAERYTQRGEPRQAAQLWGDIAGLLGAQTPQSYYVRLQDAMTRNAQGWGGTAEENHCWGDRDKHSVLAECYRLLEPKLYFEIGVDAGISLALATGPALGIDPRPDLKITAPLGEQARILTTSSDAFFHEQAEQWLRPPPELVFIDGMHLFEFVLRDFRNVERHAGPATLVVIDDIFPCHPTQAERRRRSAAWTGDVWKFHRILREARPDLTLLALNAHTTGLLLIAGLDPDNNVLWQDYPALVRRYADDMQPPSDVLTRHGAIPSDHPLFERLLKTLRQARDRGWSVAEMRTALAALQPAIAEKEGGDDRDGRNSSFGTPSACRMKNSDRALFAMSVSQSQELFKDTNPSLIIDMDRLDQIFHSSYTSFSPPPSLQLTNLKQNLAWRVSRRLARYFSECVGIPVSDLARVWYFSVWAEICTFAPIRHIAKSLVEKANGENILIALSHKSPYYFSYWTKSEFQLLLLADSLCKYGGRPILVIPDNLSGNGENKTPPRLTLLPAPQWDLKSIKPINLHDTEEYSSLVVSAGMRGLSTVIKAAGSFRYINCSFAKHKDSGYSLLDEENKLPVIDMVFGKKLALEHCNRSLDIYRGPALSAVIRNMILGLSSTTRDAALRVQQIVDRKSLKEVHICDHLFFESALVSSIARSHGVQVRIWPHSTNPVHLHLHELSGISEVNTVTQRGSSAWKRLSPLLNVVTRSELMLRSTMPGAERRYNREHPITLVLFAGAHALNRMPIVNVDAHISTYKRLFEALYACNGAVNLVCKGKGHWEPFTWLQELAPSGMLLRQTNKSSFEIEEPNMIFCSVSLASSALLEGLSRGIPCLVIREFLPGPSFHDIIDTGYIPALKVEPAVQLIEHLSVDDAYESLARSQITWYQAETNFQDHREL